MPVAILTGTSHKDEIDRIFRRIAAVLAMTTAVIGALVITGWFFNIARLKSLDRNLVSMKFNTALCFLLAGSSLWTLLQRPTHFGRRLSQFLAYTISIIGAVTIAQYILGIDLGIDEIFMSDDVGEVLINAPGRMPPIAALSFTLMGVGLLFHHSKRYRIAGFIAALTIMVVGYFNVLSYSFGVSELYQRSIYTAMAVHTAAALTFMASALLLSKPEYPGMSLIASNAVAGTLLRRFLPTILILPPLLGSIFLYLSMAGFLTGNEGFVFFTLTIVGVFTALILFTGNSLLKIDKMREALARNIIEQQRKSSLQLEGIGSVLQNYIDNQNPLQSFNRMLKVILQLTGSEYGIIDELLYKEDGEMYLAARAISNIAWGMMRVGKCMTSY